MSILTVTNLSKSFGADQLFSDITFSIAAGQKFGLVGRNGGGKTTLLRILMGQELPDTTGATPARISLAAGRRLGYLKQEAPVHPERTLAEEVEVALGPYRAAQAAIEASGIAMGEAGDDANKLQEALDAYTEAQDDFESRGGWELEGTIETMHERQATLQSQLDDTRKHVIGAFKESKFSKIIKGEKVVITFDDFRTKMGLNSLNAYSIISSFLLVIIAKLIIIKNEKYPNNYCFVTSIITIDVPLYVLFC